MDELQDRLNRTAASILENEALTDGLDDEAANELLSWGLVRARAIARSTAGMDDVAAEEAMYARLRATRRMLRRTNKWVSGRAEMDGAGQQAAFDEILELAAIVYGEAFGMPAAGESRAFLERHRGQTPPAMMIADLRGLLDLASEKIGATLDEGELNGQEEE